MYPPPTYLPSVQSIHNCTIFFSNMEPGGHDEMSSNILYMYELNISTIVKDVENKQIITVLLKPKDCMPNNATSWLHPN